MQAHYLQICNSFIRPCRQPYSLHDLGPTISLNHTRHDFSFQNIRHFQLMGSYYQNNKNSTDVCVVYLHSLNGSRLEGHAMSGVVIEQGWHYCVFDFSGAGHSQGQYLSLGYHESADLEAVLEDLCSVFGVRRVLLWGRSMGAAAAIKFMAGYESRLELRGKFQIMGLVLDSPYCSLKTMIIQIAKQQVHLPEFLIKFALMAVQKTISQLAGFRISEMQLLNHASLVKSPVLLLTSPDDKLVPPWHASQIYNAINHRNKQVYFMKGEHNQLREKSTIEHVIEFMKKAVEGSNIKKSAPAQSANKLTYYQNSTQTQGRQMRVKANFEQQRRLTQKKVMPPQELNSHDRMPSVRNLGRKTEENYFTPKLKAIDGKKKHRKQRSNHQVFSFQHLPYREQSKPTTPARPTIDEQTPTHIHRSSLNKPPSISYLSSQKAKPRLSYKSDEKNISFTNLRPKDRSREGRLPFGYVKGFDSPQWQRPGDEMKKNTLNREDRLSQGGLNSENQSHLNVITQKIKRKKKKEPEQCLPRQQIAGSFSRRMERNLTYSTQRSHKLFIKPQPGLNKNFHFN